MTFRSILFDRTEDSIRAEILNMPEFFIDLNLDQIIDAIIARRDEYNLKSYFYTSLNDIDIIKYRQEIAQDLETETLLENIKLFAQKMIVMRRHLTLSDKLTYKFFKEGWFLEAVIAYCDAVEALAHHLGLADLKSRGLSIFRDYVTNYIASANFMMLQATTEKLKKELSAIRYCIQIKESRVKVRRYEAETDYSAEIEETFRKFKEGAVKNYKFQFPESSGMDHIEAQILDFVAKLYPDIFLNLDWFYIKNQSFLDQTLSVFDREIQFYVAYIDYIARVKRSGLRFCFPQITDKNKDIYAYESFDLALASKLISENAPVVCNDFFLKGKERIFVVSGPNQGGKTTFARTFGQLHYLAGLGLPVPGADARLFLLDGLFTHFEKEEKIENLRGKLEDDLVRLHYILCQATPNSIIIMNEVFTSTTSKDALFLSIEVMEKIVQLDALCVWVTFIDELSSFCEKTVSMVSTVVPENPALRTFKIIRKPADGLAYALSIAEKYRLTYQCLKERLKS